MLYASHVVIVFNLYILHVWLWSSHTALSRFFLNDMSCINSRFTYLLTYLLIYLGFDFITVAIMVSVPRYFLLVFYVLPNDMFIMTVSFTTFFAVRGSVIFARDVTFTPGSIE